MKPIPKLTLAAMVTPVPPVVHDTPLFVEKDQLNVALVAMVMRIHVVDGDVLVKLMVAAAPSDSQSICPIGSHAPEVPALMHWR